MNYSLFGVSVLAALFSTVFIQFTHATEPNCTLPRTLTAVVVGTPLADEIESRKYELLGAISGETGRLMQDLTVEHGTDLYSYKLTIRDYTDSTASIILTNLTLENLTEKLDQAKKIFIAEVTEWITYEADGLKILESASSNAGAEYATRAGLGLKLNVPLYFSVWTELPVAKDDLSEKNEGVRWFRTTANVDGATQAPTTGKESPTIVAKLATSVWQVQTIGQNSINLIKLGTVSGTVRVEKEKEGLKNRLDLDVLSLNLLRVWGYEHWFVRPYYGLSAWLGTRLVDENAAVIRAHFGTTYKIGILLANKLFVQSRLEHDVDWKSSYRDTVGFDSGYQVTDDIMLRIGTDYNGGNDRLHYDRMVLEPLGWSLNGGVFVRF